MRIQHNIMAMNAYRNYTNNVSAMQKNLEKLSSGYKINRAGDDAAGLAISEKMRAQITGLQTAQKNAKDGISLVQTAEGALTEVHDMLNRMVTLATQSANGTYDNETDREQLQKELDQLRSEINRIADSSNFNGIKLLDGTMAEGKVGDIGLALGNGKKILSDYSFDGTAASKAGAAEIQIDVAKGGVDKSGALKLDKTSKVDGQAPSAATQAKIEFTTATGTGQIKVLGVDVTSGSPAPAGLGNVAVGASGTTISDLFDLVDEDGNVVNGGTDGHTDWGNLTANLTADKKYALVAKNPGNLGDDIKTLVDNKKAGDDASVTFTPGKDEGEGPDATQAKYDLTFSLNNLDGGQTLTIAGEQFRISNKSGDTGDNVINIYSLNTNDQTGAVTATTDLGKLADAIKTAVENKLGDKFEVGTFDYTNDFNVADGNNTFTLHLTGKAGAQSVIDGITVTNSNNKDITTETVDLTATQNYVPAGDPQPGKNAQIKYTGLDLANMGAGSKLEIGGTPGNATYTIEVVANQADATIGNTSPANTNNVKVYFKEGATDAEKAELLSAAIAEINDGTTIKANISVGADGSVTVTGGMVDAANGNAAIKADDLVTAAPINATIKGGGASTITKTEGGTTTTLVEAGKTQYEDILDMDIGDDFGKLGDHFTIQVKNPTTGAWEAATGTDKIEGGTSFKLVAKTAGKLDDKIMKAAQFATTGTTTNGFSVATKEGWDEGAPDSSNTTNYELKFNLKKIAGGQSFTIGNTDGNSVTFDLTVDDKAAGNGVVAGSNEEVATRKTIDLSKVDLTSTDADNLEKIIAEFEKVGDQLGATGEWKASASVDSNGVLTLQIKATTGDEKYNLGTIRYSQTSDPDLQSMSNAKYNVYNASKGGTPGTYAQVSYDFDNKKLTEGDVLTFGNTTVTIGDKTGVVDGKNMISLSDATGDAFAEKLEALLGKDQTFAGRVQMDTANKRLTFTDYEVGRTAEDFAATINADLTNANRDMEAVTGGLVLQIGDTADSYNQLRVSIKDMHTDSLGIDKISIASQDGAAQAIEAIKKAINSVSDVRGTLGATQNRLDHTINNLSVMTENIQDAESTIRDTDVAEEMMAYTKNNILIQSAQAMLAQANQVPQGVLQLLG